MSSFYDLKVKTIQNTDLNREEDWELSYLKGMVILVVNVASKCGFTHQYSGLEKLYKEYKGRGFEIIGAPCNQFFGQEPGKPEEIETFCKLTYDVSFPLLSKINVNGPEEAPLYHFLKKAKPGIFGMTRVKWNFEKFLIDRKGNVVKRYSSLTAPAYIAADIEKLLNL